jgi:hypothetical protein
MSCKAQLENLLIGNQDMIAMNVSWQLSGFVDVELTREDHMQPVNRRRVNLRFSAPHLPLGQTMRRPNFRARCPSFTGRSILTSRQIYARHRANHSKDVHSPRLERLRANRNTNRKAESQRPEQAGKKGAEAEREAGTASKCGEHW